MQVGRLTLNGKAVCKWKVLDALATYWQHLAPPRDFKLQDQEGHGQAFREPQEETLHVYLGSSLALTC